MALNSSFSSVLKNTNLSMDFAGIKQKLKTFLSSQDEFRDYDFEASGMSFLLDVLAYNTQMNTMTAHLALNELFLDSAQARPNIVSLAKQLGYTPRSVTSAIATINLTVIPPISFTGSEILLEQDTVFSGGGLNWYVTESQSSFRSGTQFIFSGINLKEGTKKIVRYYYDSRKEYPAFEIPDRDVDTRTIKVRVRPSDNSTLFTEYQPFTYFSDINESTPVYFLEENALGLYEIYFTGGEIGISPFTGNIVEIEYLYSNGAAANGVSFFRTDTNISGIVGERRQITTVLRAAGGSDKESVESIRRNAPYFFEAQNRCVTLNDYAAIIRKEFPQVESINVWGGEDNIPANFGRVFISIKPSGGSYISEADKNFIINEILSPKQVATASPIIVDPEYTFIGLDVVSKYDDSKTPNTKQQIVNIIKETIASFGSTYLNRFNGIFRHSKLLTAIDNCEFSIQNSTAHVYLYKKINVSSNSDNEFTLRFPSELYDFDLDDKFIQSSFMTINGVPHYIRDSIDPNDSRKRILNLVYSSSGGEQIIQNVDIGYIDLDYKIIYIYGFRTDRSTEVKIYINPKSYDIIPTLNQLLYIEPEEVKVTVEKDFIQSYTEVSRVGRNPTPRNIYRFEN